jgi:predicted Zn-dependent peptidase
MPHMASVCLGVWVGTGSRHEPAALNGAAHFIEHLLFKGTVRRTARRISEEVEGLGGQLNAYTSEDHTCFYARARHDHRATLLDVIMDMRLNSRFAPADLVKERAVIKEERMMYRDQPPHLVQELLNETLWPGHPLGRAIEGTPRSLDRLTRPRLLGFLRNNYGAENTCIVAAGNVRHAELVQEVSRHMRRFPSGAAPVSEPAVSQQDKPRVRLHTMAAEQTQLALGLRTTSRHDERRFALRVLNALFGECMSSRLFQCLREDRGIAYDVHSAASHFADTGDMVVYAGVDDDKLPQVLKLIAREMRRLTLRPPALAEVRRARDYVIGQFDLALEGTEAHMSWMGEQLMGYGQLVSPGMVRERFGAVTPGEVRRAAADFFRPERMSVALVSPLRRLSFDVEQVFGCLA